MDLGEFYPCLKVKNLTESIDFYRKLGFEMTSDHADENWAVMRHNNMALCLFEGHIDENLINFRGGDIAEIVSAAEANGLAFSTPATKEADGSWSAEIRDPDGNSIYFNTFPDEREQYIRTGKLIEYDPHPKKLSENPIVIRQTFPVPAETVWHAITDAVQMRQWFFENIPAFEAEVGFHTEFDVQSGERHFLHQWTITDVEPLRRIRYDWRYDGYTGDSFVTFELTERESETTLTLTHITREDFPDDIPEFERESGVAGWTYFITESLKTYLENQP